MEGKREGRSIGRRRHGKTSPKKKVVLLIPLNFNDGTLVPEQEIEAILHELFVECGGYTLAGEVSGAYRMSSGEKQVDKCLQVWVVAPASEVKRLVGRLAKKLGQESMYFEELEGSVDFILPAD